ncbi:hypothetical protein HYH03_001130 [Edaphochlamys debaryana]|uniref:Uncharacterized protein n=1 Tax=Edaphochlamys debaryana TaxID=47281 RepID=A0A836C5Z0_9CHLO|nr:hypothetical protein HYH03_001130 [Edaphochlamys debaryana]|eukprot:KAG2501340.1 hypothetical protein HYH03_001130 [Edaphochlamys debaryana]
MENAGRWPAVALGILFLGSTYAVLPAGNWGKPGNTVPAVIDLGPPLRCLPPPSQLDFDGEHSVWDHLYFNQIISLVVAAGANPYISQLSSWALVGWNAVALYDCSANPAIEMGVSRRPKRQRTLRNMNRAAAAAYMKFHQMIDPVLGAASKKIVEESKPADAFNWNAVCDGTGQSWRTPECVGYRASEVTYKWMMDAGWNYDGSMSRTINKFPYTDYTNHAPVNSPWDLPYPCRWQPLHETDGRGKIWVQSHLLPYAPKVKMFFVDKDEVANRTLTMWDCENPATYKAVVDEILDYSANLNDTTKLIAELIGPQPFMLYTMLQARGTAFRAQKQMSMIEGMAFGLMSVISTDLQTGLILREKIHHDAVRPPSAVRWLYGDQPITAYGGPGVGKATFPAKDWIPYVGTYNEAEFPSGAMCWCTVLTEWMELWQGGDNNPKASVFDPPITFTTPKGCSLREPEMSPLQDTTLTIHNVQGSRTPGDVQH